MQLKVKDASILHDSLVEGPNPYHGHPLMVSIVAAALERYSDDALEVMSMISGQRQWAKGSSGTGRRPPKLTATTAGSTSQPRLDTWQAVNALPWQ